jgi:aminopeptidase YwaD
VLLSLLAASCGDGGGPPEPASPTPNATSAATAPPAVSPTGDRGPPRPDVERIVEHVRVLSDEIGIRPAGTDGYTAAVDYTRAQLESYGYDVEVQEFTAQHPPSLRRSWVTVETPERREIPAAVFTNIVPSGSTSGRLVDAGRGREGEFPADAAGAIVLIQRDDVRFQDMAERALAAGANGAIVVNSEPELFRGDLADPVDLPMVSISLTDGDALRSLLAQGPVELGMNIVDESLTQNVIARPPGGVCRTLSGGHLDSVPWAQGANDNASGSGTVLELARAAMVAGRDGHCFALWGGEELGLDGSAYFTMTMTEDERNALEAYFNYDVTAGETAPQAVGVPDLVDTVENVSATLGIAVGTDTRVEEVPSDHQSFIDIEIPALVLTSPDYSLIHTPDDTFVNLRRGSLDPIAQLGFELLASFEDAG